MDYEKEKVVPLVHNPNVFGGYCNPTLEEVVGGALVVAFALRFSDFVTLRKVLGLSAARSAAMSKGYEGGGGSDEVVKGQ